MKLHLVLAFANVVGAATLGVLIGFDKTHHFLPGFVLANVYAHAHLAAIGWASMMVVGVGYRMFPMLLPSAMPGDRSMYLTAALLEVGVVGLAVALLLRHGSVPLFALIVAAGFGVFGGQIAWMRRRRRPAPAALRRPDYGVGHVMMAMASLAITVALGLALAVAPPSELALRVAMAYGVFGLLGFLGQMVAGVESRLLPIFAWYWAFANTGFRGPAPSPHEMSLWRVQQAGFYLWVAGVPALGIGLFLNVPAVVTAGAALLSAAVLAGATDTTAVLRHAYRVGRNAPDA